MVSVLRGEPTRLVSLPAHPSVGKLFWFVLQTSFNLVLGHACSVTQPTLVSQTSGLSLGLCSSVFLLLETFQVGFGARFFYRLLELLKLGRDSWDATMSDLSERRPVNMDYAVSLLEQLNFFYEQKLLTDVVLLVEDNEFPCHKMVLATCSSYFR